VNDQDFKSKFSASSDVLQRLFEDGKSPLSSSFMRWKLWMKWSDIVGTTLAQNTEPVGLKHGCLWLWVKNSTWMQQMVFMREEIRNTINQKLGQDFVKTLRFTLDRREAPSNEEDQEQFRKILSKLAPETED
jgi:predicted nucleic acid-binding Zn ribbon protein